MKIFDNSFLTILTDSTELSIAYADMARLQRSLGVRSRFIKGTFIGLGGRHGCGGSRSKRTSSGTPSVPPGVSQR